MEKKTALAACRHAWIVDPWKRRARVCLYCGTPEPEERILLAPRFTPPVVELEPAAPPPRPPVERRGRLRQT